jgi:hypothetical protein
MAERCRRCRRDKRVEIDVRREGNRSQVGHLARISDKVWRRFSALLFSEFLTQDTRRRTGPSHSRPCASRVRRMSSRAPGTSRGQSRSSTRTSHCPPRLRACRKLPTAAIREPKCSGPVGEGAKRPPDGGAREEHLRTCAEFTALAGLSDSPADAPCSLEAPVRSASERR